MIAYVNTFIRLKDNFFSNIYYLYDKNSDLKIQLIKNFNMTTCTEMIFGNETLIRNTLEFNI